VAFLPGKMVLALTAAAAAGAAMSFQGVFNAALSKRVGLVETSTLVHIIGTVLSGLFLAGMLVYTGRLGPRAFALSGTPWYCYLGGLLSVFIIIGVASAFPITGAGLGVAVIVTAQLCAALVIDHFGWFEAPRLPVNWVRLAGAALLIIGTRLVAG